MGDLEAVARMSIQSVQIAVWENADQKGFHNDRHPGVEYDTSKHMLIVGEIAEAHEELRNGRKPEEIYYVCKTCSLEVSFEDMQAMCIEHYSNEAPEIPVVEIPFYDPTIPHAKKGEPFACDKPDFKPEGNPIEIADVIIRSFDYAEIRNFDAALAVLLKMRYNSTREFMHGKKF